MQDYRVELEAYAGPMDLLLYLVKRDEIDLFDIPMHTLCKQYLEHIRLMKLVDINVASEFLVMAATLVEIKSQMLVPAPEAGEEATDASAGAMVDFDPRRELVRQLLEYKRFKDAARALEERQERWMSREARRPGRAAQRTLAELEAMQEAEGEGSGEDTDPVELDMDDLSVADLCEAFARLMQSIGQGEARHQVVYDDTPLSLHAEDILDRLRREGGEAGLTLQQMFVGRARRSEMIGLFLATLELVRQRRVSVIQAEVGGELRLRAQPPQDELEGAAPPTADAGYEWPDEAQRRRAERRAKLRDAHAARRGPNSGGEAGGELDGGLDGEADLDPEADDGEFEDPDAEDLNDAEEPAEPDADAGQVEGAEGDAPRL